MMFNSVRFGFLTSNKIKPEIDFTSGKRNWLMAKEGLPTCSSMLFFCY